MEIIETGDDSSSSIVQGIGSVFFPNLCGLSAYSIGSHPLYVQPYLLCVDAPATCLYDFNSSLNVGSKINPSPYIWEDTCTA